MDPARSPRDDLTLEERLARVDVAALSDANKTLRILPPGIRPMSANARLLGRAVTADAHDDLLSVIAGLDEAGPGDVLVVCGNGSTRALAGELFATEAARRGLAGIVLDGYCRDSRTLRTMQLPVFARGVTPRAAGANTEPTINVPLTIGDVTVNPGDYLVGDTDGILVATRDELTDIIYHAESIQFTEEALISSMAEGVSLLDKLNFHDHAHKLRAGEPSTLHFLV